MLARQVLYHLNHTPNPFGFSLFFKWYLRFLLKPSSGHDPPKYLGLEAVATITSLHGISFLKNKIHRNKSVE
jgi:hypothetical protein